MLTGIRTKAVVTAATALAASALAPAPAAANEVDCPDGYRVVIDGEQVCYPRTSGLVPPDDGGFELAAPRGRSGGGVETWCVRHGQRDRDSITNPWRVHCHAGGWWFIADWDCYAQGREIPADPAWPRRGLANDEEGRVLEIRCYPPQEDETGLMFMNGSGLWLTSQMIVGPANPPGLGGTPSVIPALWMEAVNALGMRGPEIVMAPPASATSLVNLPVWLWTETGGTVWPDDPLHEVAEAPEVGQRVDAFAEPVSMEWDMGDGRPPVICEGPGDAWDISIHHLDTGECHHIYRQPSRDQPGGTFDVTAVTTWRVWWWINGEEDGELEVQVGTTTSYRVDEVQVLVGG